MTLISDLYKQIDPEIENKWGNTLNNIDKTICKKSDFFHKNVRFLSDFYHYFSLMLV